MSSKNFMSYGDAETILTGYAAAIKSSGGGVADGAGAHNGVYRGKYLGTQVTAGQWAAIGAGTFDDLFIGDYWTIGSVNWRIAAFDYWLHCGNTELTTHHVVIVPDTNLYRAKMNDSDITTGGYVGSKMYTTYIADAKTTIQNVFGSTNILRHRELFANAVYEDEASGWAWYDSSIDLMNEIMVYGHKAWASHPGYETGIDKGRLPLFALDHSRICNRTGWWLRDVMSAARFANIGDNGNCNHNLASDSYGVRPAFGIC